MRCNDIQKILLSFIDLELPLHDMGGVKNHLISCTHCAKLASQIGTPPDFSPLFSYEKNEAFWKDFDSALYKKLEVRKRESRVLRFFNSKKSQRFAIAAGLLIFLLTSTLFFTTSRDTNELYLPSPKDQGVSFSLSPVGLSSSVLEFAPDNTTIKTEKFNHAPILENVDYRRDVQNGFY